MDNRFKAGVGEPITGLEKTDINIQKLIWHKWSKDHSDMTKVIDQLCNDDQSDIEYMTAKVREPA